MSPSRLPHTLFFIVDWIVLAKPNWQDPLLHTWSTNHSVVPTGICQEQQGAFYQCCRGNQAKKKIIKEVGRALQERISTLWHPQEANANLQLCHFSPHRHPECCSCEVMSVVMVTVCEPGIARPLTSPFPPFFAYPLAHSPPPLPPCLTSKSIAETNVKWLQTRRTLLAAASQSRRARENQISVGEEEAAAGGWWWGRGARHV